MEFIAALVIPATVRKLQHSFLIHKNTEFFQQHRVSWEPMNFGDGSTEQMNRKNSETVAENENRLGGNCDFFPGRS